MNSAAPEVYNDQYRREQEAGSSAPIAGSTAINPMPANIGAEMAATAIDVAKITRMDL